MATDQEKWQFERLIAELRARFLDDRLASELLLLQLESITGVSRDSMNDIHEVGEFARSYQRSFEEWYRSLGFDISVPFPAVIDEECFRRAGQQKQALFYRPPSSIVSYEALMKALQPDDWTTTDQSNRAKIGWEPTKTGYWFWAEIIEKCPRSGDMWSDIIKLPLLSLEEYVIVWWSWKRASKLNIDTQTTCCLRTHFGTDGIISVEKSSFFDGIHVRGFSMPLLQSLFRAGGRIMEKLDEESPEDDDTSIFDLWDGDD